MSTQFLIPASSLLVSAGLAHDTAPNGQTNTDGITSDPTIAGTVYTGNSPIKQLLASVDTADPTRLVDVTSNLSPALAFQLDPARLGQIHGGPLADGPHTVRLEAVDVSGQSSGVYEVPFTLDTHAPVIAIQSPARGLLTNQNVPVTGTATDATSTVVQLQDQIDARSSTDLAFDKAGSFSFVPGLSLDGSADGTHVINIVAQDIAGNVSAPLSTSFILDATRPVVTVTQPTSNPLTNQNLTITGMTSDNLSGVQTLKGQLDGGSLFQVPFDAGGNFTLPTSLPLDGSADGSHTYQFQATDKAGNVSSPASASFTLDATPPVIAMTSPSVSLTTNANITVNGKVTDNLSGVASLTASVDGQTAVPVSFDPAGAFQFTTAFPLNGTVDGLHTITFNALDKAGNSALPAGLTLTLDTTGPSIVITSPQEGSLHNVNVTVAGLVADQTSGVASLVAQLDGGSFFPVSFDATSGAYSFVTQLSTNGSADGTHTVNLQATDQAGNVSPLAGVSFILDTTAPVVTVTSPTGSPLTNQNLTVLGPRDRQPLRRAVPRRPARRRARSSRSPSTRSGNFTCHDLAPLDHTADGPHTLPVPGHRQGGQRVRPSPR